jgi:hypothetical protein
VNPGLQLYNVGMDFEVTPKLRLVTNANFLWFDTTEVLEQLSPPASGLHGKRRKLCSSLGLTATELAA